MASCHPTVLFKCLNFSITLSNFIFYYMIVLHYHHCHELLHYNYYNDFRHPLVQMSPSCHHSSCVLLSVRNIVNDRIVVVIKRNELACIYTIFIYVCEDFTTMLPLPFLSDVSFISKTCCLCRVSN